MIIINSYEYDDRYFIEMGRTLDNILDNKRYWKKLKKELDSYDRRKEPEYKFWRAKVFKRDKYTCQMCGYKFEKGIKYKSLQAHHIKQVALYPELIYDIDNGITLCVDCHRSIPIKRGGNYDKS
jgi:5-methylcytosine-specific restriction endonuclease McrA